MAAQIVAPDPNKQDQRSGISDFLKAYPELSQATKDQITSGRTQGNVNEFGSNLTGGIDVFKNSFKLQTGRDPNADELNGYVSRALFPAWNQSGKLAYGDYVNNANAYISNNFDLTKMQAEKGSQDAVGQYDSVNNVFKSALGRDATQEEKDHFGRLLANKNLDPYSLNDWIKQLPESVAKQDTAFRDSLRSQMSANDSRYFNEQIMPGMQAAATKQGRSLDSSGVSNSLALAAQSQNTNREGFLSNLAASQYGGNQNRAYNDYLNQLNQHQAIQNNSMNRFNDSATAGLNRGTELQNYDMQQQAYNQYLSKYGKRSNNGVGGLIGGGIGGAVGAYYGGPAGATAGYQMGSGLGTATQNYIGGSY